MKTHHLCPLFLLFLFSCTYNKVEISPVPPCDGTLATYSSNIAPLVEAKCATGLGSGTGCHDAWILTYGGLKTAVDNGSLIETCILDQTMPKLPNNFGITALTEEEKNLIICWVEQGAPNN